MGQEMIRTFHKWSVALLVLGICGGIVLAVLFWKFQYGSWWAGKLRRMRQKNREKKHGQDPGKRGRRGTALFLAGVLLIPGALSLGAEAKALGAAGPLGEGQDISSSDSGVSVELEGESVRPDVYQDTATAEITFHEKNFDESSVCVVIGDETGRETRLTLEDGQWKGLDGLGDGILEMVPCETGWFLDSEEGLTEHTTNRTVKMWLRFPAEGSFEIREIVCTDLAGNESRLPQPVFVTVDRTPPKLQMVLPETAPVHEGYYDRPVTVWLYLKEHNFRPEKTETLPPVTLEKKREMEGEGDEGLEIVVTEGSWAPAPEKGEDWYKLPVNVAEDGNYQLRVSYEDPAGWPLSPESVTEQSFTVDTAPPEFGQITVMGKAWNAFMEQITFGYYSSDRELAVLEGRDRTSPVEPLCYICSDRELTKAELAALPEAAWQEGNSLFLEPDVKAVIYLRVTDYAGFDSYFSSEGLIVENKGPVVTITPHGDAWMESGIYRGDVELTVLLEEPEETGAVSGLKQASYRLEAERDGKRELLGETVFLEAEGDRSGILKNRQESIFLAAEAYDGETLWVTVFAEDMAGNRTEKSLRLSIDRTAPKVQILYGEEQPENGVYYNQERRVQLVVDEVNFSEERVWLAITNTDGPLPEVSSWSHDGRIHSCQIVFSQDGDYTFSVRCEDLAGYASERTEDGFTIDRTPPEISVEFTEDGRSGNSRYYKEPRMVQVTLKEHNFKEAQITQEISAVLDDGEVKNWELGDFDSRGDVHTAAMTFAGDGDYHFFLSCKDLAGNQEEMQKAEGFSVDCTPPSIEIFGLEDRSAHRDEVGAKVCFSDRRLIPGSTVLEVSRLDPGENKESCRYRELPAEAGNAIVELLAESFPETEGTDGLYLLRAAGKDLAGNETQETRTFSVNRYGSVYAAYGESEDWLGAAEYSYLPKEREVVIREYNVDPVENFQAAVSRNGELFLLEEGKNFQREQIPENQGASKWQVYEYRIKKEVFEQEGDYELLLYSEDRAGNKMGNELVKNTEKAVRFAFSVDKTGPTAVLSGGEDGSRYKAEQLEVFLDVRDNMRLGRVEVRTKDKKELYTSERLEEESTAGGLPVLLSEEDDWQTLEVYAEDLAGNRLELGNGHGTGAAGCMAWRFLVTSDRWIQLYKDPAGFIFVLALGGGSLAAGILFVRRQRQKAGEKKNKKENLQADSKKKAFVIK